MKDIIFVKDARNFTRESAFVAHIPWVKSKEELLLELYTRLEFPDYFGFNWDALDECLRNFEWIVQKEIVLVHDEIPLLSAQEMDVYKLILVDTINGWNEEDRHSFEVVFPG